MSPAPDATPEAVLFRDARVRDVLARHVAGALSGPIALMQLLIATESVEVVERVLADALTPDAPDAPSAPEMASVLARLAATLRDNREGCARIAAMLRSGMDTDEPCASVDAGIAFCTRLFDWSVQQSEEASVALYSLGNPAVLAEATREVVDVLARWGVLGTDRAALQIGCGIGRLEVALAGRLREAHGIDVSPRMVEVARRRCKPFANVQVLQSSGRDLQLFPAGRFDLVYAVDTFPYLYQSGPALVDAHFGEVRRVLRAGGDFVVLNFSYRGDAAADQADVRRLAGAHGFELVVDGGCPFTLWDGVAFHLRAGGGGDSDGGAVSPPDEV